MAQQSSALLDNRVCYLAKMNRMYDGILGDRSDPLMQDWVQLDKKISARLFANGLKHEGRVEVLRKNYYECVRNTMSEYVSDLNDIALHTQL